jgi:hypothetical protein
MRFLISTHGGTEFLRSDLLAVLVLGDYPSQMNFTNGMIICVRTEGLNETQ